MTRIAFYAPMKPPDDPVPSGDRQMARNLMAALELAGFEVRILSTFRSRDGRGDPARQADLLDAAEKEIAALSDQTFDVWLTYHSYYKAPDLIGPALARARDKPYVQIEATRARKRLDGSWSAFAAAAEAACDQAALIFYLTQNDRETLERFRPPGQTLAHLPPFLSTTTLPAPARPAESRVMFSAGMMRQGAKMESYALIAATLPYLTATDWSLRIAGDGPMRRDVETLFSAFGARVEMLGELTPGDLRAAYRKAALFFWPGVQEAFGMVYLEAQAAGLPVVAQNRPGVIDVLAHRTQPEPGNGPAALAKRIDDLLAGAALREAEGRAARQKIQRDHLLGAAANRLASALQPLAEQAG